MALPADSAAQHSMDILMEMAGAVGPLSRTALRDRTALGPRQFDEGLGLLTRSKLVCCESGSRGRYVLAQPADSIRVGQLREALGGKRAGRSRQNALPALADMHPETTLDQLHEALSSMDAGLCPYFDVCVALGGPEGPVIASPCTDHHH
jgi:DNA-binding IscR family transcriptional regulator